MCCIEQLLQRLRFVVLDCSSAVVGSARHAGTAPCGHATTTVRVAALWTAARASQGKQTRGRAGGIPLRHGARSRVRTGEEAMALCRAARAIDRGRRPAARKRYVIE